MSNILTFTVRPDSHFYTDYFEAKAEKQKFHDIAVPFLEKHGIEGGFYIAEFLAIEGTSEQREKFSGQLLKKPDHQGFYRFYKKSPIEKAWESEVAAKINFKVLEKCDHWYFGFINAGKYKLWDWKGTIYGYLENKYANVIQLDERWMSPIKVSEYYSAIEAYEDEAKQEKEDE